MEDPKKNKVEEQTIGEFFESVLKKEEDQQDKENKEGEERPAENEDKDKEAKSAAEQQANERWQEIQKNIKYYGIKIGNRYRAEKNGYIYKILNFPQTVSAADSRDIKFNVEVRTPAGALFQKSTDLAKLLKQLESGNFQELKKAEYISHKTQVEKEERMRLGKEAEKIEKKAAKEKKKKEKAEEKEEEKEKEKEEKDEEIEKIDEAIEAALKEANEELDEARKKFVETEQEYRKFKGLLGSIKGVVLSGEKAAIKEEYEKAKETYEQIKGEVLGGYVDKLLAERIKLIDLKAEKVVGNKSWLKRGYEAYKKLGEYNLEKVIKPKNRLFKFAARMVSVRTGVSLALLGGAVVAGGGAGAIGALTARRIFGGVGAAVGSYDLMDNWARSGELKKGKMADLSKEEMEELSDKELEERLGFFEADALLTGEKLSENKIYKGLLKEFRKRVEQKRTAEAENFIDRKLSEIDKQQDKIFDKLKFDKKFRKVISLAAGVTIGSGAFYEVVGKPVYEAVAEPLHETKKYVASLLWGEEVTPEGLPKGGVKETAGAITKEVEPGKNLAVDSDGNISYEYNQKYWDNQIRSEYGELARIGKGEGITHALARQIENWAPDQLESVGFTGDPDNMEAVRRFAVNHAKALAVKEGYIDLEKGQEIWVKESPGYDSYYFLSTDGKVEHIFIDPESNISGPDKFSSPTEGSHKIMWGEEDADIEKLKAFADMPSADQAILDMASKSFPAQAGDIMVYKEGIKGPYPIYREMIDSQGNSKFACVNYGSDIAPDAHIYSESEFATIMENGKIAVLNEDDIRDNGMKKWRNLSEEVSRREELVAEEAADIEKLKAFADMPVGEAAGERSGEPSAVETPAVPEPSPEKPPAPPAAALEEKVSTPPEAQEEKVPAAPEPAEGAKEVIVGENKIIFQRDSAGNIIGFETSGKYGYEVAEATRKNIMSETPYKEITKKIERVSADSAAKNVYVYDQALKQLDPSSKEYSFLKKMIKRVIGRYPESFWDESILEKYFD